MKGLFAPSLTYRGGLPYWLNVLFWENPKMDNKVKYWDMHERNWKYQLAEDFECVLHFCVSRPVMTDFIQLIDNHLFEKKWYGWEGCSGPTVDTKNTMRAGLVHDSLYQLMRTNMLDRTHFKNLADTELRKILIEDKNCRFKAWYYYQGVQ